MARKGRYTQKQIAVAERELKAMRKARIQLSPANIVARARPRNSPIHGLFQWNDTKAADHYRLEQARSLVGAIMEVSVTFAKPHRSYHNVHVQLVSDDEKTSTVRREYTEVDLVRQHNDMREEVNYRLTRSLLATVREAKSLLLPRHHQYWKAVCDAVDSYDIEGFLESA